ncbi:MAG TPA: hypothetical protein VF712_11755 [Thermoleophilaceae bacterium]|jgi:hypothetical protein
MDADLLVDATRAGWLTLCFMMLASRVVFQAAGAEWMRSFLDRWQAGGVKRVWGAVCLAFAGVLLASAPAAIGELRTFEVAMLVALVALLAADGLVNVMPAGFTTFKDRVQEAWVRRRGADSGGDRGLFAAGNALLALASAGAAAAVILYKPVAAGTVALAAGLAIVLTAALILWREPTSRAASR